MMNEMNYRLNNPTSSISVDKSLAQVFVSMPRTPEQIERFSNWASMSKDAMEISQILQNVQVLQTEKVKQAATELNFCTNNKEYKLNPDNYVGNTADFCAVIRLVVSGRIEGCDLYSICNILGGEEMLTRLNDYLNM